MAGGGGAHYSNQSAHPSFSDISSIKALKRAWQKFSRGKKSRADVAAYQADLKRQLTQLHRDLVCGRYEHARYQAFTIQDPKQRQIHKATVRDRLVHQAIVTAIEPLFESRFIHDSYSCRVGKGTHAGRRRLLSFLRQESRNNTRKVYVLKCDVRRYFASIDHEVLLRLVERRVHDERVLELIRSVLLSHGSETGRGIPLGNVTSQLFANIYLHELDWYVKQQLGVRYYARYCDDFVIVSHDREYLRELVAPLQDFLWQTLRLELHPQKITIRSWGQGVDFLGFVLLPHAVTIRTKTRRRMVQRVTADNLSSYLGICMHTNGHHTAQLLRTIAREAQSDH